MTFLLDVNVLIALIDPAHVGHEAAHHWFEAEGKAAWATCPMTENGVIRITGHPKYPNTPGSAAIVAEIVAGLHGLPGGHGEQLAVTADAAAPRHRSGQKK